MLTAISSLLLIVARWAIFSTLLATFDFSAFSASLALASATATADADPTPTPPLPPPLSRVSELLPLPVDATSTTSRCALAGVRPAMSLLFLAARTADAEAAVILAVVSSMLFMMSASVAAVDEEEATGGEEEVMGLEEAELGLSSFSLLLTARPSCCCWREKSRIQYGTLESNTFGVKYKIYLGIRKVVFKRNMKIIQRAVNTNAMRS